MALLKILKFPDPKLKLKAAPVTLFDSALETLVADMLETMYAASGVGLAATQVDIQARLFVMDLSEEKNQPHCFINPEIVSAEDHIFWNEACLSFPGVSAKVKRARSITIAYQDEKGIQHTFTSSSDLAAVCIQHEIDHLDGITFFDHLPRIKQKILRLKIKPSSHE